MLRIAILMGVIAMFTGSSAFAEKEFTFHKDNNFEGSAVKAIKIDMAIGDIAIAKSNSGKVEVNFKNDVYAADQAEADKYNEEVKYSAELSGDKLVISIEFPRHSHSRKGVVSRILQGDWEYDYYPMLKVSVPDSKDIQISSASADIEARDVTSNLDINSASSNLNTENTIGAIHNDVASGDIDIMGHRGPISIKGISSDIQIGEVEGNVDCYTSSGDCDIEKVTGDLKIKSTSGDNIINDVSGNLDVRSTSGDISVDRVGGSVIAEGVSGDIRLKSLSAGEGSFKVSTVSGDAQIGISPDFKGDVQVSTASGSIDSGLKMNSQTSTDSQLSGSTGQGNGKLTVSTVSGDININRF